MPLKQEFYEMILNLKLKYGNTKYICKTISNFSKLGTVLFELDILHYSTSFKIKNKFIFMTNICFYPLFFQIEF